VEFLPHLDTRSPDSYFSPEQTPAPAPINTSTSGRPGILNPFEDC
jgi:hypothetical protein